MNPYIIKWLAYLSLEWRRVTNIAREQERAEWENPPDVTIRDIPQSNSFSSWMRNDREAWAMLHPIVSEQSIRRQVKLKERRRLRRLWNQVLYETPSN